MLSDDDHPGLFIFMIGLIVVVMGGVALSLVIDRRMGSSSSRIELEASIAQDAKVLADLQRQHNERSRKVAQQLDLVERHVAELSRFDRGVAEVVRLAGERATLERDIAALAQNFAGYRDEYRRKTWAAAAGQKIPLLKARGGREYHDVIIVRVTEVGLEIRHGQDGIARIAAPDLGDEWQERMQWKAEERREQLAKERQASAAARPVPPPAKPAGETRAMLRAAVLRAGANVESLRRELATAQANRNHGRLRSVPGSLETWDERVQRLSAELERAELVHEQAKVRLAAAAGGVPPGQAGHPD